eukprot:TRINITY_DN26004_c0_g1_i1.p1 TRINITY_DN26004_c0_g1~~TRINITY_DN26004_c0_g1_i1.p1  ORF type:complete len:1097 (-),score=133.06 TRINITY_DN26004_c0_g1_i1:89-3379(-)
MWGLATVAVVVGALVAKLGFLDSVGFSNDFIANIVAVTGDAHQTHVARDVHRQQAIFARAVVVRENIRDVHLLMRDNVQSQLFMGSIILGTAFSVFIEGYPSSKSVFIVELWVLVMSWCICMAVCALWLALYFQQLIDNSVRKRLISSARALPADDAVINRIGGNTLSDQLVNLHGTAQSAVSFATAGPSKLLRSVIGNTDDGVEEHEEMEPNAGKSRLPSQSTRGHETSAGSQREMNITVDSESMRIGEVNILRRNERCWIEKDSRIVSAPSFLIGEVFAKCDWIMPAKGAVRMEISGNATLYMAAQCLFDQAIGEEQADRPSEADNIESNLPNVKVWLQNAIDQVQQSLRVSKHSLTWPEITRVWIERKRDDRWQVSSHEKFGLVENISMSVSEANETNYVDLPLYKVVLCPRVEEGDDSVCPKQELNICWEFPAKCTSPIIVVRQGQICHPDGTWCHEDDWPVVQFFNDASEIQPYRAFSAICMRLSVLLLMSGAALTYFSRALVDRERQSIREMACLLLAFVPAVWIIVRKDLDPGILSWEADRIPHGEMWVKSSPIADWQVPDPPERDGNAAPAGEVLDVEPNGNDELGREQENSSSHCQTNVTPRNCFSVFRCCDVDNDTKIEDEMIDMGRIPSETHPGAGLGLFDEDVVIGVETHDDLTDAQHSQAARSPSLVVEGSESQRSDPELSLDGDGGLPKKGISKQSVQSTISGLWARHSGRKGRMLLGHFSRRATAVGILFCFSVAIVFVGNAVDAWFGGTLHSVQTVSLEAKRRAFPRTLDWQLQLVNWPAFVRPVAIFADAQDGKLFAAAGRMILPLRREANSKTWRAGGGSKQLPAAALALSSDVERRRLYTLSHDKLYVLEYPNWTLALATANATTAISQARSSLRLPPGLGSPVAVASLPSPLTLEVAIKDGLSSVVNTNDTATRSDVEIILFADVGAAPGVKSPRDTGIFLCRAFASDESLSVRLRLAVDDEHGPVGGVVAAFVCAAGVCERDVNSGRDNAAASVTVVSQEDLLWLVDGAGAVLSVGLRSGQVRGAWALPEGVRGKEVLGLTGDATHFWVASKQASDSRVVLHAAPFPSLAKSEEL